MQYLSTDIEVGDDASGGDIVEVDTDGGGGDSPDSEG